MATRTLVHHVSDTAYMVAHYRALESARPDALFSDPLAARLAGDHGRKLGDAFPTAPMSAWTIAIRTRIIDEYVHAAVARGIDTIVNLGAGLDTRPYRLDLPPTLNWIEVDYPDVINFKEERLASETPRCRLVRIGLDLALVDARRALLTDIDKRTTRALVLTEGVIPYLDLSQAGSLADDLRALNHVESWIVDYLSPESVAYRKRNGANRAMGDSPFKFEPTDWTAFFASHGWKVREMRYLGVDGPAWGRRAPFPLSVRAIMKLLAPFTPAGKKASFAKYAGYAVLEPAAPAAR
jgi:methyltransferase (TIGR00027 family)